ncbi:MAG: beta-ketoacyl-[acyl-carrier-protein] synthase family protein [Deltaproteobacteria bacterium]|nr:beta-ketoacyl-[acyl-carrier-protein] synthase family protein [Deltaproteobacteria bacterium]
MSQPLSQPHARDVVITGMGIVSPYGRGCETYWNGLSAGTCALGPLTLFPTEGFPSNVGGQVPDATIRALGAAQRSRANRLLLAAADEAVGQATLSPEALISAAVSIGSTGGGMLEVETWHQQYCHHQDDRHTRGALRTMIPATQTEALARRFHIEGPRESPILACSSSAAALVSVADLITTGVVEVGLAGGVDSLTRVCFMGFNALKLLDKNPCRPFARDRRGMSVSEGAAVLVLESYTHAVTRGAPILAFLAGGGISSDAFHQTSPPADGEGAARAMREALTRAGLTARDVPYVNAHGTGTVQNDKAESSALEQVFGAGNVLVSGTKSLIGHTMGAAGAMEAVATILALNTGLLPPTANLDETDPEVPFDCIPRTARACAVDHAMSNSFGFGGQNVSLIFRHPRVCE